MKNKVVLLLGAGYLSMAMVPSVMAEPLSCISGSSGGSVVKCHTAKGFALGCILTSDQIVKFRELVDGNLQKNGYVSDLQKNGDVVAFTHSWNGISTKYETTWDESTSSFFELIVSNPD